MSTAALLLRPPTGSEPWITPVMPQEIETLAQGVLCATRIVAPMAFLNLRGLVQIKVNNAFEGSRLQMNMTVVTHIEPKVNTFVDSKTRDQPMLVVNMCAQRANTIRGENVVLHDVDVRWMMNDE